MIAKPSAVVRRRSPVRETLGSGYCDGGQGEDTQIRCKISSGIESQCSSVLSNDWPFSVAWTSFLKVVSNKPVTFAVEPTLWVWNHRANSSIERSLLRKSTFSALDEIL
jgi:hypothetical protein